MRRVRPGIATGAVALILLAGCSPSATVIRQGASPTQGQASKPTLQEVLKTPYDGPKPRLAVMPFESKAAGLHPDMAAGVADMLTTALVSTGRFVVLERERIKDLLAEQDAGASGRVKPGTAAPIGELEGAEFLIRGAITEFEPQRLTAGGLVLGAVTLLGSVAVATKNDRAPLGMVTFTEAHIALDLRVVDARTGRVVHTAAVEGLARKFGGFVAGRVGGGKTEMPLVLGGFSGTAMESAIRACLEQAAVNLVQRMAQ